MAYIVFKTHNVDVCTLYNFAAILNNRGFSIHPKAKGMKMNSTKIIVVDLQSKVYTPYALEYVIFSEPASGYFIELKD